MESFLNYTYLIFKKICISSLFFLLLICLSTTVFAKVKTVEIEFYGQQIHLEYEDVLAQVSGVKFNEPEFTNFLKKQESKNHTEVLRQLQGLKSSLNLNDWMYFDLLHRFIGQMLVSGNDYEKTLLSYYLLAKSGYDSKITFLNHEMWLNVYTEDKLYEISTIFLGNKNFVNLTAAINKQKDYANQIYLLEYPISNAKKAFSFDIISLPNLASRTKEVEVDFDFKGTPIHLEIEIDLNLIELINNYPIIDEVSYLETPLSPTAIASLRPQLMAYMKDMNEETKMEFLVSITRMAFDYKEDYEAFGRNKPMIAEELFFHQYSDCEDRCALFYNLNKITLDLPLLIIALPDHLSIAVAMQTEPTHVRNLIKYEGRDYYFCDPTGPFNAHYIGSLPKEYRSSTYQILSSYK